MKWRTKTWLKVSDGFGIAGLVLLIASSLFVPRTHPEAFFGVSAAFVLVAIAFTLNGYLGVKYGKMHMKPGRLITRKSRGDKMFNMDIVVQFGGAILFLVVAYWFLTKALA